MSKPLHERLVLNEKVHRNRYLMRLVTNRITPGKLRDGAQCKVIGGTHAGKFGAVIEINTGKTGYVSITVVPSNGERFKTLAKNVMLQT